MTETARGDRPRVAYLVSRYPAVSHTFILREVRALREQGVEVETFSVRRAALSEARAPVDREELATTSALLPTTVRRFVRAHARALVRAPAAYVQSVWTALRLTGDGGPRTATWQLFYFAEAMLLWDALEARGIRHVHVHFANVASDVALLAVAFGRRASRGDSRWRWTMTVHGPTEFYDARAHKLSEKVRRAERTVCVSDFTRSQVMGLVDRVLWRRLTMIRCGIDSEEFAPAGRSRPPAQVPRILTVARLAPVKGHAVLLEALSLARERGLAFEATFVGDGPERRSLEEQAEALGLRSYVTFLGAVGQDGLRAQYAAADVFCLPSFAEGLPVVLMEAMAMELPVIATDVMGVPELVEHGVSGLTVPPARPDAIASALGRLAEDPALGPRLGRAGRERVVREYDIRASATRLADVFRAP